MTAAVLISLVLLIIEVLLVCKYKLYLPTKVIELTIDGFLNSGQYCNDAFRNKLREKFTTDEWDMIEQVKEKKTFRNKNKKMNRNFFLYSFPFPSFILSSHKKN